MTTAEFSKFAGILSAALSQRHLFLLLSCMSCSNILEFKALSVTLFPNIFSQSEGCLFILLIVSFAVQALINLIKNLATVIRQGNFKNSF